ncbi:MAG: hypothetical protein AAGG81_06865 [Chlamydiota bacterium]
MEQKLQQPFLYHKRVVDKRVSLQVTEERGFQRMNDPATGE